MSPLDTSEDAAAEPKEDRKQTAAEQFKEKMEKDRQSERKGRSH